MSNETDNIDYACELGEIFGVKHYATVRCVEEAKRAVAEGRQEDAAFAIVYGEACIDKMREVANTALAPAVRQPVSHDWFCHWTSTCGDLVADISNVRKQFRDKFLKDMLVPTDVFNPGEEQEDEA